MPMYGLLGYIYFRPSLYLWNSASDLKEASYFDGNVNELVLSAVSNQAKFWRFIGITTIVFTAFYLLAIMFFVCFGAAFVNALPDPSRSF